MNREQYLLNKLAEECAEVAQRASKAICFGLNEVQPGQDMTNSQRIAGEMADLLGVYRMLQEEFGLPTPSEEKIVAKRLKVEKYAEYSTTLGILDDERKESI